MSADLLAVLTQEYPVNSLTFVQRFTAPPGRIGVTWYAGTNKGTNEVFSYQNMLLHDTDLSQVVIVSLPVIPDPGEPPYWLIRQAD